MLLCLKIFMIVVGTVVEAATLTVPVSGRVMVGVNDAVPI